MKSSALQKALLYLLLTLLGIIFLFPLLWMVRSSFMGLAQVYAMPPEWIPRPFTLDSYIEALTSSPFATFTLNTVIVVTLVLTGILLTASLSAYGFSRVKWKGRDLVFGVILSSMMMPLAVTLIPQFIVWKYLGFYDTLAPLIVPSYFGGGAFNIFLLRQFFLTIPKELDEAAIVDGATHWQIYGRIILPLGKSALIVVGILAFMFHWNDFFVPLIYLSDVNHFTLAIGLQQFLGQYVAKWHVIMAAATLVVTPCIVIFLVGQKFLIEGITMTGIKA